MPLCWLNAMSYLVMGSCTIRFLGNFPDRTDMAGLEKLGDRSKQIHGLTPDRPILTLFCADGFVDMSVFLCSFFSFVQKMETKYGQL